MKLDELAVKTLDTLLTNALLEDDRDTFSAIVRIAARELDRGDAMEIATQIWDCLNAQKASDYDLDTLMDALTL